MIWNAWNKALGDSKGDYDDFWPSSNGITSRKIGVLADILRVSSRIWCINLAERKQIKANGGIIQVVLPPRASLRRTWYLPVSTLRPPLVSLKDSDILLRHLYIMATLSESPYLDIHIIYCQHSDPHFDPHDFQSNHLDSGRLSRKWRCRVRRLGIRNLESWTFLPPNSSHAQVVVGRREWSLPMTFWTDFVKKPLDK